MKDLAVAPNPPDFDGLARLYRWMEYLSFGPMLERCRFRFLDRSLDARFALILGDGDGRFTARLIQANPKLQIDAVDASAAMLAALERRAINADPLVHRRLRTIHADLRHWTPDKCGYDLVVSHFFLDCLSDKDVANLLRCTVPNLASNATWIVSEFAVPAGRWRSKGTHLLIRFLYFAFARLTRLRVKQIPNYAAIFQQYGFQRTKHATFLHGLLTSEVWSRAG